MNLLFSMAAADRGLVPDQTVFQQGQPPATFWRFPTDYTDRLPGIIAGVKTKVQAASAAVAPEPDAPPPPSLVSVLQ